MTDGTSPDRRAALEAGAGRPFRFRLVLEESRGRLQYWLGGRWALGFGVLTVSVFSAAGAMLGLILQDPVLPPAGLGAFAAAAGSLTVAVSLRARTVRFERRDGTWGWLARRPLLGFRWTPLTEETPLRLEREVLARGEDWTLYAGPVRLFSYLGDPVIGRRVTTAFLEAGFPVRTIVRR